MAENNDITSFYEGRSGICDVWTRTFQQRWRQSQPLILARRELGSLPRHFPTANPEIQDTLRTFAALQSTPLLLCVLLRPH
jgi:hypothetical protein